MWSAIVEWRERPLWLTKEASCARWFWMASVGGVGFLIGSALLGWWGDVAVSQAVGHARWVSAYRPLIQAVSDWGLYVFYAFFLGVVAYAVRYPLPWPRTVALGWVWAELIGSLLAVQVIKTLAGRARPEQAWLTGGADQWFGLTLRAAYHSFPSGHTADAFISAAFVVLLVRSSVAGCLAWGLALAIAFSRIALAKHYLSDVLAGAVLAGVFTWLVVRRWRREG